MVCANVGLQHTGTSFHVGAILRGIAVPSQAALKVDMLVQGEQCRREYDHKHGHTLTAPGVIRHTHRTGYDGGTLPRDADDQPKERGVL